MYRQIVTRLLAAFIALPLCLCPAQTKSPSRFNAAVNQAGPAPTLEQRVAVLEERLDNELALKEERVQDLRDRIENVYKLVQFVVAIATIMLVAFSIRDVFLRWREGQRQRGIDDIVKETMRFQNVAVDQQVRFGALQLRSAEANAAEQFEPVRNVNDVIGVVQKTLAFRLEQEQKVAETIREIERMKADRDRANKLKLEHAMSILEPFKKMSRMEFAALTDEQYKRAVKLVGAVADLDEVLTGQGFDIAGNLFYTSGVIAYYDNDIIEARSLLDRAASCRASDHEGELSTNDSYRIRFAFIHYFRALIQKNWGDLSDAAYEIEQSAKLLASRSGEFLTPVTHAEILSYITGEELRCRIDLGALVTRMRDVEVALGNQGHELDSNQVRLRNRMLILMGNTHFVENDFTNALNWYRQALDFNATDYYALFSAAQCYRALNDHPSAKEYFTRCIASIERSGDLRRKRERITRAVIAAIAAMAAHHSGDLSRYEDYSQEARDMLSGNLAVGKLSPKFFSPGTKRLVTAAQLLAEVEALPH